jgi:hypothetical protein
LSRCPDSRAAASSGACCAQQRRPVLGPDRCVAFRRSAPAARAGSTPCSTGCQPSGDFDHRGSDRNCAR